MKLKHQNYDHTIIYWFHKINDHKITRCYQLAMEIKRLIKRGHLKKFIKREMDDWGCETLYDDDLVIEAIIHNFLLKRVLVNNESKVNIFPDRVC
ncbi:hypothetical protein P3X46_025090 [Hevea brasiliensis]|uniref:Domain X domain-containing protein n=1 Tax=Hevea brasiliensis TaxID=3981 RepID=A0ABQ9L692_HEVBR|nr:hypothetical protein P3X46_025090 [Hevea brasiliensis]